ncbi:hypothetical protein [Deinococcus frigens]|uniref:hypothetical protein n=1 Tax=Deinococcus frigens TaxID=249403 RepID=UPI0004978BB5|nr:hypothetical protein [Deinococcus frigens]
MTQAHRKHVVFPPDTLRFLEDYQRKHQLPSFSATIEAAALALQQQELRQAYEQYAQDFARDAQAQAEAEEWLDFPMNEGAEGQE